MKFQTLEWRDGALHLLDQRALPRHIHTVVCPTAEDTAEAIRNLTVRGAPAIGVAAAYGMAMALTGKEAGIESALVRLRTAGDVLKSARPTAVNLAWAVDRMMTVAGRSGATDAPRLKELLASEPKTSPCAGGSASMGQR
jgi:methylthioribose-1-phosphate isomerase